MSTYRRTRGLWALVSLSLAIVLSTGCAVPLNPATSIMVDRPEVFTRERLIGRRFAEQQRLEKLLEEPVEEGYQGLRDVRSFVGVLSQLGLRSDPRYEAFRAAELRSALETQEALRSLRATTAEIELLRATELLETLQQDPSQLTGDVAAAQQALADAATALEASLATIRPEGSLTQAEGKIAAIHKELRTNGTALPDFTAFQKTGADLTPAERLRDQIAYRNVVESAMREQELDDTHDLIGSTIYTL